ncbi:MAG: hypothetical protein FWD42_08025 [Solirubrobacterales bacterium]|nr:hypothetical protein [Solirubrobacterales bacterium]
MSFPRTAHPSVRRALRSAPAALAALAALTCGALPATAQADVGAKIIERCTHNESLSGFSQQDYRRALQEMPTEVSEYSDCGELIRKAELAAAGTGAGAGAGAGAGPAAAAGAGAPNTPIATTPAEQHAIAEAHRTGGAPVQIGKSMIRPGVVHADVASVVNSLPSALLATLALLLAGAVSVAGGAIRRRVIDARDRD